MSTAKRRFWKQAAVVSTAEGFTVELDGRPVRLPAGSLLAVPQRRLADALAAEWQEAGAATPGGTFGPEALPLTRITGTMVERVATDRTRSVASLLDYGGNDLLCYRASWPAPLVASQAELWDPWLDWCLDRYGARLETAEGIMPISQPEAALNALRVALDALPNATLAGLGVAVPALGSLVLGLALAEGRIDAEEAASLASLDERAQMALWGEDAAALDRIAAIAADVQDALRFMQLSAA